MSKFEKSMGDLEKIVADLERGDMSLDDMLTTFEKGVKLSRECAKMLDASEKKVNMLVKNSESGEVEQVKFDME